MGAVQGLSDTEVSPGANQYLDPGDMTGGKVGGYLNPLDPRNKSLLGLPGAAPVGANIQQGTSIGDVSNAQTGAARSLSGSENLLAALNAQNGVGRQTNVAGDQQALYSQMAGANGIGTQSGAVGLQQALNQQLAANNGASNLGQVYGQGQQLAGQLAGANAVGNQSAAIAGQQQLAQQYGDVAAGRGPNPAQAALNNATGQNVANQAALMAGQRGAASNVGLMARQAGMQGANIQQQAVGQSAEMQAQQQLAGMAGLSGANQSVANIAGQQLAAQQAQQQALAGQAAQQVGLQQTGVGAQAQMGGAQIGQQQAQQNALASQANTMAANQMAGTTANSQAHLENQQQMQNALGGVNTANVSSQGNVNAGNVELAKQQGASKASMFGGVTNAAGGVLGSVLGAEGGEIRKMADGGSAFETMPGAIPSAASQMSMAQPGVSGPSSSFGKFLSSYDNDAPQAAAPVEDKNAKISSSEPPKKESGLSKLVPLIAAVAMASKGGMAEHGGKVVAKNSSQKAVKKGNSYDNDKVPAMLSEGEIVIPRAVLQSRDPVRGAADFVAKVMAKRGRR